MGTSKVFSKDPEAVLDFEIDWSAWLGADTIAVSEWTVADGITREADTATTTSATIWLSGGTAGADYSATNRITTAAGRVTDCTLTILVRSA